MDTSLHYSILPVKGGKTIFGSIFETITLVSPAVIISFPSVEDPTFVGYKQNSVA